MAKRALNVNADSKNWLKQPAMPAIALTAALESVPSLADLTYDKWDELIELFRSAVSDAKAGVEGELATIPPGSFSKDRYELEQLRDWLVRLDSWALTLIEQAIARKITVEEPTNDELSRAKSLTQSVERYARQSAAIGSTVAAINEFARLVRDNSGV